MVKKIIFIFIFVQVSLFQENLAQEKDTFNCERIFEHYDKFYKYLEDEEIIGFFQHEKTAVLLYDYDSLVIELYSVMCVNGYDSVVADLIIDSLGNVKCIRFQPTISNPNLSEYLNEKMFSLKFSPALQNNQPTTSYYSIGVNSTRFKVSKNRKKH